jgi:uncharacterized DUF497 family protein
MPPIGAGTAIMQYNFEWDPVKAASNAVKHGVTFEQAIEVSKTRWL